MTTETFDTWAVIERGLDEHEFPYAVVRAHGGVPPNTVLVYCTSDLVNLLMTYISKDDDVNRRAFILQNDGLKSEAGTPLVLPGRDEQNLYEVCARWLGGLAKMQLGCRNNDDGIVFCETETDFWIFWLCVSGRSSIYRLAKDRFPTLSYAQVVDLYVEHHRNSADEGPRICVEIVPIGREKLGVITT